MQTEAIEKTLEPIKRLTKDLKEAAITLSDDEARFLVDAYYAMQENRKRTDNQVRALSTSGEPHAVIAWLAEQDSRLEKQVARALTAYIEHRGPAAAWALSQIGIGPIITAGLFAHIDITKAPTVGHIWNFAGQNPKQVWERGQKRPWNAALKVLCWKAGESFVKVSGNENAFYGREYVKRKALETQWNEEGKLKEQAAVQLVAKRYSKETKARECYEAGTLPPAHIHARSKRWVVKLFLSHLHAAMFFTQYGRLPPAPYALAHLGHAHYICPPNADKIPGFIEALRAEYPGA